MASRDYQFRDSMLRVKYGNIAESRADAIVSSDDHELSMAGGVSGAILQGGGDGIQRHARKFIPLQVGDVVVTTAGALNAKYVFHAVTLDKSFKQPPTPELIRRATHRCLQLADALNLKHLAFPALGTGFAGAPFEPMAEAMMRTIADYLNHSTGLKSVSLVLYVRPGTLPSEQEWFYERITSRATLDAQQSRLLTSLRQIAQAQPEFAEEAGRLTVEAERVQRVLATSPQTEVALQQLSSDILITPVSERIAAWSRNLTAHNHEKEVELLELELNGLLVALTTNQVSLNHWLADEAKYGGVSVPPRTMHAIKDLRAAIGPLHARVDEIKQRLTAMRDKN